MNREYDLILARMRLECINEAMCEIEIKALDQLKGMIGMEFLSPVLQEINDRLWAATYILQKEDSGAIPNDFTTVMAKADMWDVGIDGHEH